MNASKRKRHRGNERLVTREADEEVVESGSALDGEAVLVSEMEEADEGQMRSHVRGLPGAARLLREAVQHQSERHACAVRRRLFLLRRLLLKREK